MAASALPKLSPPKEDLPWLSRLRETAFERFVERGFPKPDDEEWRLTRLDALEKIDWSLAEKPVYAEAAALASKALCEFDAYRLVFINGHYIPDLSRALPKGAAVGSLAAFLKTAPAKIEPYFGRIVPETVLGSLNRGLFSDGAFISLPSGVALDKPIHCLFIQEPGSSPVMTQTRSLIVAGPGSRATVIEERVGASNGVYWTNAATDIFLEEGSTIERIELQREALGAYHTGELRVWQRKNSRFVGHAVSLGGKLSRHDAFISLDEEGTDCQLNGLYVVSGDQHVDHHTKIDHAKPHGKSRELYKGVLDGSARAVFDGLITVRPLSQKTDGQVYNRNLILSKQARVDTKPEFRIHANDVQCKHGATIGQLSEDALFYLRSRGVALEEARGLLVHAFASEMIEKLPVESLREALEETLRVRLSGGAHA